MLFALRNDCKHVINAGAHWVREQNLTRHAYHAHDVDVMVVGSVAHDVGDVGARSLEICELDLFIMFSKAMETA